MKTYVIAAGNAFDGITLTGPYDDFDVALEAAQHFPSSVEWTVVEVESPETDS